jgi:hypothetical protein
VLVVIFLAIVAVLAGVFFAATGRGGELAYEHADHAPLDLGPVSAPDVALLRPPTALWGYNMHVTDEALDQIARAMRDRDVTIAHLQEQLANRNTGAPALAHARQSAEAPGILRAADAPEADAPKAFRTAGNPDPPQVPRTLKAPGVLVAPLPPTATQPSAAVQPSEVTQPSVATQPSEAVQPPEVTQPSVATQPVEAAPSPEATQPVEAAPPPEIPPAANDAQGPQGSYDTHGWWSQQEEAAREEEARRQAAAQEVREVPPADAGASESGVSAPHPDPLEDDSFGVAEEQSW